MLSKHCLIFTISKIVFTCIHGAYGLQFKCPPPSQRQFRAKALCSNPATYYCLQDDLKGGFTENCSKVDFDQPGKRIIIRGGFSNGPCSINLYQPRDILYWTNVSTDCIYHKSLCSEEGQKEYDDGGVNLDRTCTCDYNKEYAFVNIPRDPCFCKPSTEDCTCYTELQNLSHIWPQGNNCHVILNTPPSHVEISWISRGQTSSTATTQQLLNTYLNIKSIGLDPGSSRLNQKAVIGFIMTITIVLMIISILLYFFTTIAECCWCRLEQLANKYIFAVFVIRSLTEIVEHFEGELCTLECELSSTDVICFKDDIDITRRWQTKKTKTGYTYTLVINPVTTRDNAVYRLKNENGYVISQTILDCRQMPTEILKMPEKDRDAFLKAVKEGGRASRLFIRIMLVGKSGAGKTSLLKRLLEEDVDISKIQSTDGVNIDIRKCRINLQTEKWIYSLEPNKTIQEILKEDTTDIAYCGFWDFAGQKEFYATHQTFLTQNAIYLLVFDLSEDFKGKTVEKNIESEAANTGEYIDFWIDNIHCYVTDEPCGAEINLRPPIMLVGTCIDKIKMEDLMRVSKEAGKYLDTFIPRESRKWKHIIGENAFLVSNSNPEMEHSSHQTIKDTITEFAKDTKQPSLPVQWILMEKVIAQMSYAEDKVISYEEVERIAKDKQMRSDLVLFLRYEHEIGNIIFFEDVKQFIILDHQWLVDAFRCLVGPQEFIVSYKNESVQDGKCSKDQIKHCLTKCPDRHFEEKLEFLITIFEKFDILVRPQTKNGRSTYYYIPCMMPAQSSEGLWDMFGGKDEGYVKTSWLCMDLEFLPPALFNHILAMYIQNYETCFNNGIPSFSKNIGTFYIHINGLYKLALFKSLNSIALQILEDKDKQLCYSQYRKELIWMVKTVFTRYGMRLTYRLKLKCFDGSPHSTKGKHDIPIIKKFIENVMGDTYHCEEHESKHNASTVYDSWFGKRNQTPPFSNNFIDDGQLEHTCEFCSHQCVLLCVNCQQNMCCECFDKHHHLDKKQSHRCVIYDKYVLERKFFVNVKLIADMVVLSDGLLVFVNHSGYLVTYDNDGENRKTIPLYLNSSLQYASLTVIDNNNVAVLSDVGVLIVDVRRQHIIRKVTLKSFGFGIMFIDHMIYIGRVKADSLSIQVLDISDLKLQKIITLSYIPRCLRYGNNERIYCLTLMLDIPVIVIYDMDWNELLTLEDLNIPTTLGNITVDNDGNALVLSDNFNGSVIKITPNGKAFPIQSLKNVKFVDVISFHTESKKYVHCSGEEISIYEMKE